jgi:hypothetical protein
MLGYDQFLLKLKSKPQTETLTEEFLSSPENISLLMDFIHTQKGSTKFLCEKVVRRISEINPSLLYPYFDTIVSFLSSESNIIRWGAFFTLANMASVDNENKFESIFELYFSFLSSQSMITASNVVKSAPKIIAAKPALEETITNKLLSTQNNTYYMKGEPSGECKNVLYSHLLDCFDKYFLSSHMKREILDFAKNQLNNSRASVAKKAGIFVKKYACFQ